MNFFYSAETLTLSINFVCKLTFLFFNVIFYHKMSLFLEKVNKNFFQLLVDVQRLDEKLINQSIKVIIYILLWFVLRGVVLFLRKRGKLC